MLIIWITTTIVSQALAYENEETYGTVGLDTSSFLYQSSARGTSATTFEASIHGSFENAIINGKGDLLVNSFISPQPQGVVEAHEAYLTTGHELIGNLHLSLGRKYYEWSKLDEEWNMMSLWSPRYTWDQLHPQSIGMTGIFLSYETPRLNLLVFASPIAIPERGTPVEEKNGNIVSPNPLWNPLPTQLNVLNTPTNINYKLMMPSMNEILLRPNFALRARYDFDQGLWFSLNTGVLPIHMVQMAAEPFLDAATTGELQVNIRPQLPMRNINTAEIGYEDPHQQWSAWFSASYEQPFHFKNETTWLNPIITPTTIVSAGNNIKITSNFWLYSSALFISEEKFNSASSLAGMNVNLPSRFPIKQAIKLEGAWQYNDTTLANISWMQDLAESNHLLTLDVQHQVAHMPISIGAGTDVIMANNSKGGIGQYFGNDRLRGWLKYAF